MNADHDTSLYEKIKDEEERLNLEKDVRGSLPVLNPLNRQVTYWNS